MIKHKLIGKAKYGKISYCLLIYFSHGMNHEIFVFASPLYYTKFQQELKYIYVVIKLIEY